MGNQPTSKVWRVAASSVCGASHLKSKLPCQDAVEWRAPAPGLLLAAAADGAGSASESALGASIACRTALDWMTNRFGGTDCVDLQQSGPGILKEAFQAARDSVLGEADHLKLPSRELACTLLLLAATSTAVCSLQVGDGATLVLTADGQLETLTAPPEAEYLNETFFLVMENAVELARESTWSGPVKGVTMFTDGLQMLALKLPGAQGHPPFFTPLFHFLEAEPNEEVRHAQLERFLTSPRIVQRADDDLTLLLGLLVDP